MVKFSFLFRKKYQKLQLGINDATNIFGVYLSAHSLAVRHVHDNLSSTQVYSRLPIPQAHTSIPIPLAPNPIRVQSCVCCLF